MRISAGGGNETGTSNEEHNCVLTIGLILKFDYRSVAGAARRRKRAVVRCCVRGQLRELLFARPRGRVVSDDLRQLELLEADAARTHADTGLPKLSPIGIQSEPYVAS